VHAQAPTSLRRPLLLLLLALAVLAVPAVSGARRTPSTASLRAQDAAIEAKRRAAVLDLYSLDHQYAAAQSRLAGLQLRLTILHGERTTLRHAIVIARRTTRIAQGHLAARLQLLYERGEVEPLDILLGATSLDEALTALENLKGVAKQDTAVLREVVASRASLTLSSKSLDVRLAEIAAATQQAASTAAALAHARAERSAYIDGLVAQRRLNERAISALVAQASAAEARTITLSASGGSSFRTAAPVSTAATAAPAPGDRTLTVSATAYSLPGHTASGLPVGWGVVAVDPSVIPLGTHMYVPGYGEAVAADTGSAVIGDTIDLWFPTVAQADAWGRRTVTVTIHS
jgi:3D (Asp-Asp-Asp) domain-containing protein